MSAGDVVIIIILYTYKHVVLLLVLIYNMRVLSCLVRLLKIHKDFQKRTFCSFVYSTALSMRKC